ncbi:YaaC family protein [Candidatus Cryosericum terrychapinii]|uniref:YaaC family protein n=1 Tax=Candidatus Cryosericum terrychapinii TaxID=2290919 RepID=A0A398CW96_9BACT|nr:hypothetical protein [Candidatus Cryosericum terrychapinii]RIE06803.1 hypothetical protein SMC7_00715 [Candidatus Cryosericum terrychapinii]
MDERTVYSEHPETTQWEMLMQYSYELNVAKELSRRRHSGPESLPAAIAGAFSQAYEYFHTSSASSLYTSPLLVYYGMANLLSGACQMMAGSLLEVEGHGMSMLPIPKDRPPEHLADVTICPSASATGALSVFGHLLCPQLDISRLGDWTLSELFARIPDLYDEYYGFYRASFPGLIPVARGTDGRVVVDRVEPELLERYPQLPEALDAIPGLSSAYLDPQDVNMGGHRIVLYRRSSGSDITLRAVSGSLFLCTGHGPTHANPAPIQEILLYMTSFALSFLSRYHPELWNPFVKTDFTGERLVFAKCVDVTRRTFPNLVLNQLLGYSVEFGSEREQPKAIKI